ncbi:MAG: tyrosine-type recombinase/integrase [Lachnospiraceae bacterium]|nr:tyrosine-type recombinase/integrase [Lachnospiraceae bacterium]
MPRNTYHEKKDRENIEKMREILKELPSFTARFFRSIEDTTAARTKLAYAYDLRVFFSFLKKSNPSLSETLIRDFPMDILEKITREDVEEYLEYCSLYDRDGETLENRELGKKRKLASLRSFYKYFYTSELISKNPAELVPMPKIHEKNITRLEPDETAKLLDLVEDGQKLTKAEQRFHSKTKVRDLALVTLLLGTGIRVSECVGLDLSDVDFETNGILIRRKGGKEQVVYFGDEVEEALKSYLAERSHILPVSGHEEALFLSLQNRRISVRAVENLVKKYASKITTLKTITPHKLRSTYGTSLYRETGDIYLVADVLGHTDVNTTRKHYAAQEDENRRRAANKVRLRRD